MANKLFFLLGPTASGKSEVALVMAPRINAEIISLDSMLVYKGMDIGTDKPAAALREKVAHHLIDIAGPQEAFSLGRYVKEAEKKVAEISGKGKRPLFVGGTGLYLKGLLKGIFSGPPAHWALREKLQEEAERHGPEALYEQLKRVDPEAAKRISVHDLRRIIRALEVCKLTGKPISKLQTQFNREPVADAVLVCLNRERGDLYHRIDERVERMFASGLVDEVKGLLKKGNLSRSASQAVGYKETIGYLEGRYDLAEAQRLIKRHTRRLVRRQLTWFRSFPQIKWLEVDKNEPKETTAKKVINLLGITKDG
jgi:tRNA dimethylallyltransferase